MNRTVLESLLEDLGAGRITAAAAFVRLRDFPVEDLGFAQVDHHRAIRQDHPEVVLCEHKAVEHVLAICQRLHAAHGSFLGTRASPEQAEAVVARYPATRWDPLGRTLYHPPSVPPTPRGRPVAIVTAGTSDLPVANEAATVAEAWGARVERITDVGVAGLHRVLAASDQLRRAGAIIVVAGMEGALPSVVGGLVDCPVIAVPTSVGCGASFGGLAALLGMLNSCAAGVTVVNIDNGFGAAVAAARIVARTGE
ncbi:MAG: nickel pincer cofactor biosynthesis protein LarB [Gemmatimonadota bacterium]|nr:nickel pincer cofactor biosynthesis protein LarB [Gemmatimonadota bacterium]